MSRMCEERLAKRILYSELQEGKRKRGGQYLRFKDVQNRHFKRCGIDPLVWEKQAQNRLEWRRNVHSKVYAFEDTRRSQLDKKRDDLKARPPANITYNVVNGVLTCPLCARSFTAKVGYASHLRAHERAEHQGS